MNAMEPLKVAMDPSPPAKPRPRRRAFMAVLVLTVVPGGGLAVIVLSSTRKGAETQLGLPWR
jgi:hypothetical protein